MIQLLDLNPKTESLWNKLYGHSTLRVPFYTFRWHQLWWDIFGESYQPLILLVDDFVIAPLAKKDNLVIFSGGVEISDYMDLVGPEEKKSKAWEEILKYLKENGISEIKLKNISQDSSTLEFFKRQVNPEQEDTTPKFKLPKSWDEYLFSLNHKHRHELRRKLRKFEREQPGFEIIEGKNIPGIIEEVFRLMKLDERKSHFLTPEMQKFFSNLIKNFKDLISIKFLKRGDEIASFIIYFIEDGNFLLYNSGINEVDFPGAGFYLKAKNIQTAIEEGGKEYNFLQGSERYKYELGGQDFFVYNVSIQL